MLALGAAGTDWPSLAAASSASAGRTGGASAAVGGAEVPPAAAVSEGWAAAGPSSSRRMRRRRSRGLGRARGRGDGGGLNGADDPAEEERAVAEAAIRTTADYSLPVGSGEWQGDAACPVADVSEGVASPDVHVPSEDVAESVGGAVAGGAGASTSSAAVDDSCTDEAHLAYLGAQLYPLVVALRPDRAGKIVGMILELDAAEVEELLVSSTDLADIVTECHGILEAYDASVASSSDEAIARELQQQEKRVASSGSRADAVASVAALRQAGGLAAVPTPVDRELELVLAVSAAEADLALSAPTAVGSTQFWRASRGV